MASHKKSARAKRVAEFKLGLASAGSYSYLDEAFGREDVQRRKRDAEKEAQLREKACESKKRYSNIHEANDAIASCADYGTKGLHTYKCEYCDGWHLTSRSR